MRYAALLTCIFVVYQYNIVTTSATAPEYASKMGWSLASIKKGIIFSYAFFDTGCPSAHLACTGKLQVPLYTAAIQGSLQHEQPEVISG